MACQPHHPSAPQEPTPWSSVIPVVTQVFRLPWFLLFHFFTTGGAHSLPLCAVRLGFRVSRQISPRCDKACPHDSPSESNCDTCTP